MPFDAFRQRGLSILESGPTFFVEIGNFLANVVGPQLRNFSFNQYSALAHQGEASKI